MIRKFKALGLALVAVFAMSAVMASAAQATAGTLTTFPAGSTVKAHAVQTGIHKFELTSHPVLGNPATTECTTATFEGVGTVTEGATTVRVHPVYEGCKSFGLESKITTTGCDYLLHTGTPTLTGGWHVTTDVVCAAGSVIRIVAGTCEVTVGSQNGLTTSEVTNGGTSSAMDLILHTNVTGITYTVVKAGIGCPLQPGGTGTFGTGDYKGTTTVTAKDAVSGAAVGVTIH